MRALKVIGLIIGGGMLLLVGACAVLIVTAPPPADEGSPPVEQPAKPATDKPEQPDDYLKLSGTTGQASCSVLDDDSQRSIDTPVPATIKLNVGWAGVASVSCQKEALDESSLRMELVANGETKSGETTAQAGVVSLTAP